MYKEYAADKLIMFQPTGNTQAVTVVERFLGKYCVATTDNVTLEDMIASYEKSGHLGNMPLATKSTCVPDLQSVKKVLGNTLPSDVTRVLDNLFKGLN